MKIKSSNSTRNFLCAIYGNGTLISGLIIILCLCPVNGAVSFDIPEDHKDFAFLDSLYTRISKLDKIVKQKEKRYLTDPLVARQKKFVAKEEYFDLLVESQTINSKTLLAFYNQLKQYYESRMLYFEKLLSILEGDSRAPCFALYRQARDNYGAILQSILKYTPQEIILSDD